MKGQNINENIRKILDSIDFCELVQAPAVLLSIDFEKAFDRVNHELLFLIMEWFGFGKEIIHGIHILYRDMILQTVNNGYYGEGSYCIIDRNGHALQNRINSCNRLVK